MKIISFTLDENVLTALQGQANTITNGNRSELLNAILLNHFNVQPVEYKPIELDSEPIEGEKRIKVDKQSPKSVPLVLNGETKEERIARMTENQRIAKERNKNRLLTFTAKPKKES